jgi:tetratricopeptide (TPR) repeat protein
MRWRRTVVIVLITFAVTLTFGSCSSAPEPATSVRETRDRADRYLITGNRYYSAGDFQQAAHFFELALEQYRSVDDLDGAASTHIALGSLHAGSAAFARAEGHLERALDIAEQIESAPLRVEGLNAFGELELRRDEPAQALARFEEALEIADSASAVTDLRRATVLHNAAVAQARLSRYDAALVRLRNALEINEDEEAIPEQASNHYMLASVHSRMGADERALEHARRALELDKRMENSIRIAEDLVAIAEIYRNMDLLQEAEDYFGRALEVYRSLSYRAGMRSVLLELRDLAERSGNRTAQQRYEDALGRLGDAKGE